MTETQVPVTPTDSTGTTTKRKRGPAKRVLGDGDGDHCIYEIAPEDSGLPRGSLIPLPNVPRFRTTHEAVRWVRNESKDLLVGKQLMVLQAKEIFDVRTIVQHNVVMNCKPKVVAKAEAK